MSFALITALMLALYGHLAIAVMVFNRIHAAPLPCRAIKVIEKTILVVFLVVAVYLCLVAWQLARTPGQFSREISTHLIASAYACGSIVVGVVVSVIWIGQRATIRVPSQLLSNHTDEIDVARQLGGQLTGTRLTKLLSRLPGNEILRLTINKKEFELPRLARPLDGLTITHFSDLHLTGQIKKEYFEFLVDRVNELESDMIVITGDIVDKQRCLEWLPDTLGRLKCEHGPYFVLGNHDKRLRDVPALRRALEEQGLIDLGGRWLSVGVRGGTVVLAGNEVPWFSTIRELEARRPRDSVRDALTVLLSHSPDQIAWARKQNFDLMLAGHTHGGQIRLPVIGPVVSPSNYGVKYASGTFFEPPTLLHVSRGISGVHPLRFNCTPELTQLVLRRRAA